MKKIVALSWIFSAALTNSVIAQSQTPTALGAPNTPAATKLDIKTVRRPRIAVVKIEWRSSVGDLAPFEAMLATALSNAQKFDVIERTRLSEIVKEQEFSAHSGLVDDGLEVGHIKGVDYLVYGAVTQSGRSDSRREFGGYYSGRSTKVKLAVDIKLVDAQSAQTIVTRTVLREGTVGGGAVVMGIGGGSTQSDPVGDVMRATADAMAAEIATSVFPIKVLTVQDDGGIVINYGDGVIANGDVFDVCVKGKPIIDQETGENYGAEETNIGRIRVKAVLAGFSKCEPLAANGQTTNLITHIEPGAICRPVSTKNLTDEKDRKAQSKADIQDERRRQAEEVKRQREAEPRKSRAEIRAERRKKAEEAKQQKEEERRAREEAKALAEERERDGGQATNAVPGM